MRGSQVSTCLLQIIQHLALYTLSTNMQPPRSTTPIFPRRESLVCGWQAMNGSASASCPRTWKLREAHLKYGYWYYASTSKQCRQDLKCTNPSMQFEVPAKLRRACLKYRAANKRCRHELNHSWFIGFYARIYMDVLLNSFNFHIKLVMQTKVLPSVFEVFGKSIISCMNRAPSSASSFDSACNTHA